MDAMEQIKATFFQECEEQLADLEAGLLALQDGEGDSDTINAVFRAVHSVKGGAGAFGFEDLVRFAHVFETTLEAMRSGALQIESETLKVMLRASDVLADQVSAARGDGVVDAARAQEAADELVSLISPGAAVHGGAGSAACDVSAFEDEGGEPEFAGFVPLTVSLDDDPPASTPERWRLTVTPTSSMYAKGHDASVLLREVARLGDCEVVCDAEHLPEFDFLNPEEAYLSWTVLVDGSVDGAAILDVFDFVGDDCPISLERVVSAPAPGPAVVDTMVGAAPAASSPSSGETPAVPLALLNPVEVSDVAGAEVSVAANSKRVEEPGAGSARAGQTIRVDLERVDRLIDLVGELVINQAVIAQRIGESEMARTTALAVGLDELEQLTREIQDSCMAIRAQPVKSVFQRMPRLVREIAAVTGKEVRLVTEGEGTEVDKTVIERLSDPITHMLRNAIDHGLETPNERLAAGKPIEGTVRLAALHRSGRIVIEVSDDGKGINRQRVKEIAVNKGLIAPEATLTDEETDNLIFLPGFSTAQTVSDISGRGVGMDVVKRSIQALGGRITISSIPGKGSTFTMSLPLTLAVLDGMVVTAGEHTLVLPLSAIVETLRPKASEIRRLGPRGAVLAVRGAHVPLIDIGVALGWRDQPVPPMKGVTLLVDSEVDGRAALVVDAIQGQRQVVIKSLEANYQRVDGIAAATILGDGRVALILDIDAIVEPRFLERLNFASLAEAS